MNPDNDLLTIASWNIEHDGWESDGRGGGNLNRWYAAHEFLAGLGPFAAVARQEMTHSLTWRGRMAWQAGSALGGLIPFVHPTPTPASRNPTGLLLDTREFWPVGEWPENKNWWHGPTAVEVRLAGTAPDAATLVLGSVHLSSRSPHTREVEADMITGWMEGRRAVLVTGDMNSYSAQDEGLPNFDTVIDRPFTAHRTLDGRTPHTVPDEILRRAGLVDLARYAAEQLGQPEALAPTGSMRRPDQGGGQRIDRAYLNERLAPALRSFEVHTDLSLSDHSLLVMTFDRQELTERLNAFGRAA
ncbi:endonuclease/exonuclease/phosphatase family protein [Kitasatospora sp. NPDC101801]|uniref:endonuclease/exonuclease/phosphatase family protein n=1 Tax=Kitasatospora sp. NPDC101801 TaxID=3364103 RepID=UPI0037FAE765